MTHVGGVLGGSGMMLLTVSVIIGRSVGLSVSDSLEFEPFVFTPTNVNNLRIQT